MMGSYKAGTRVRFIFEGTLIDPLEDQGDTISIEADDHSSIYVEAHADVAQYLQVLIPPLPTEPGIYVPRNNAGAPGLSYIYRLSASKGWSCFDGNQVIGNAQGGAERAHRELGGLVSLGVVE